MLTKSIVSILNLKDVDGDGAVSCLLSVDLAKIKGYKEMTVCHTLRVDRK